MESLENVTQVQALRELRGHNNNWNSPKITLIPKGEILNIDPDNGSTRYGDLFFKRINGESVSLDCVKVTAPCGFCKGKYDPKDLKILKQRSE